MVALRRENLNPEVSFSPHRSSISVVERQTPQIAGSEDFIPLESFSVNPLTTKLLWKNPKVEYSRSEYYNAVGRNPKGNRRNSRIIHTVLENHGVNNMMMPFNLIPVVDQALGKVDIENSEAVKRARGTSKSTMNLQDIYHQIGHQNHPSSSQVRILRELGARYGVATREQEREKHQKEVERNRETLTRLFETDYNRVVRFIAVRIGNIDEAQDLANDVFVLALKAIGSYKDTGVPMEAWLFKIARNRTINYINRDKNRKVANIDDAPPLFSDDNPDDVLERDQRAQSVRRVMKILNPYQRRVLELSFWGDMTIKEVAAALGKTAEQVKAVQTRAIYRLRELMAENRELLSA